MDGQFAEGLAVEGDVGGLHAGHKRAVLQPLGAHGRIDADDPQAAEVALLALAVLVRIHAGTREGILGVAIQFGLIAKVTLGFTQGALAARFGVDGVGYAGHGKGRLS